MNLEFIYNKAKLFVENWIVTRIPGVYRYHTIGHTREVTRQTIELAESEGMGADKILLLGIASLFHDTGYAFEYNHHEANSCSVYDLFCEEMKEASSIKEDVHALILSTKYESSPQNLEEKIMRDADLHYLGTDRYFAEAAALRSEWEFVLDQFYSEKEWVEINLFFMKSHLFFTQSAIHKFEQKKSENLKKVQELFDQLLE